MITCSSALLAKFKRFPSRKGKLFHEIKICFIPHSRSVIHLVIGPLKKLGDSCGDLLQHGIGASLAQKCEELQAPIFAAFAGYTPVALICAITTSPIQQSDHQGVAILGIVTSEKWNPWNTSFNGTFFVSNAIRLLLSSS